jgi:hypothetical protein
MNFRFVILAAAALALTACASAFVASAERDCDGKGLTAGSAEYVACVQDRAATRQQNFSDRMGAVGTAMRGTGQGYSPAPSYSQPAPSAGATGCMFQREVTSGFNKICYYNCMGSQRAVTQEVVSLCPLTL